MRKTPKGCRLFDRGDTLMRDFSSFDDPGGNNYTYRYHPWEDGNGCSHMRASLPGPSLTIPFVDLKPMLGTWQQIIHVDFDIRPHRQELVVQIVGNERQ